MGLSCRIIRDNFDNVTGVLAPNGQESILFKNVFNYLTGRNLSSSLNESSNIVQENVSKIFEQNSELSKIGSQEEYSLYVDSIFPNSKIKNILVRGDNEKYDTFQEGLYGALGKGIYFSDSLFSGFGGVARYVVVDVNNPMMITDEQREQIYEEDNVDENFNIVDENININRFQNEQGNDAIVPDYGNEYVIFDSSKIFTLGSQQDLEGFKNYKKNNIKRTSSQTELNEALSIFSSAYTQGFQDFYTDEVGDSTVRTDVNNEPVLEDVLTYLKSTEKNNLSEISVLDLENFKNQNQNLDYSSLEGLLYQTFLDENGNFLLDEDKVKSSGLYNQQEIDNLLQDEKLQDIIKNNVLGLSKENLIDNVDETFINIALGNEYDSFGKLKTYDSNTLLNVILKNTVQASTEDEFDNFLKEAVSENIYNAIVDNQNLYDSLMDMTLNLETVEVKAFENGSLVNVLERNIFNELKETLIINNLNKNTLDNLKVLENLDYDVLLENESDVIELIKSVEKDLINSNIDVIGLSEKFALDVEKSHSFIKSLTTLLDSIDKGYVNDEILRAYSEIYNDFFQIGNVVDYVNIDKFDNTVIKITTPISKIEAYTNGYLKMHDDYYLPVINASYDDILNSLMDSYQIGENLLDDIIPNNLTSENQYKNYVDNIVLSEINNFGEEVSSQDLEIFKSIKLLELLNNVDNGIVKIPAITNVDSQFIDDNFLSDLNNIILNSKYENSPLYDKIFKYLEFKGGRVDIKENENLVLNRIENVLSESNSIFKTLKEYFKSPQVIEDVDDDTTRDFYFSNPSYLQFLNSNYSLYEDQISTIINANDFIRTKEGVFEKIDNINGSNIYSKLILENGQVKLSNMNKQFEGSTQAENLVKFNNVYSQKEKEGILKEINNCN